MTMEQWSDFDHVTKRQRVSFAHGRLREQLERATQGSSAVLVIASARARTQVERDMDDLPLVGWFDEVREHVPADTADRVVEAAMQCRADLVISIGGGSAVGLAKIVARDLGLPVVAVPTTFAGSEATNVWGRTEAGVKVTGTDDAVLPREVIYDVGLVEHLPTSTALASGVNALAHSVDALWAPCANPITETVALEAVRRMASALRGIAAEPSAIEPRRDAQLGSYLSALAFSGAGSALHHKICHVLGGAFDLPHAETHAVVLPHVLEFNAPSVPHLTAKLADALDAPEATRGIHELLQGLGLPVSLKHLGLRESALPDVVSQVLPIVPATNPRSVNASVLTELLRRAWTGRIGGATG